MVIVAGTVAAGAAMALLRYYPHVRRHFAPFGPRSRSKTARPPRAVRRPPAGGARRGIPRLGGSGRKGAGLGAGRGRKPLGGSGPGRKLLGRNGSKPLGKHVAGPRRGLPGAKKAGAARGGPGLGRKRGGAAAGPGRRGILGGRRAGAGRGAGAGRRSGAGPGRGTGRRGVGRFMPGGRRRAGAGGARGGPFSPHGRRPGGRRYSGGRKQPFGGSRRKQGAGAWRPGRPPRNPRQARRQARRQAAGQRPNRGSWAGRSRSGYPRRGPLGFVARQRDRRRGEPQRPASPRAQARQQRRAAAGMRPVRGSWIGRNRRGMPRRGILGFLARQSDNGRWPFRGRARRQGRAPWMKPG